MLLKMTARKSCLLVIKQPLRRVFNVSLVLVRLYFIILYIRALFYIVHR